RAFEIVLGKLDKPARQGPLSLKELAAFARIDLEAIHAAEQNLAASYATLDALSRDLGEGPIRSPQDLADLQDACYGLLSGTRAHEQLAARIRGEPIEFADLARSLFGDGAQAITALDRLLAVMAFARRKADKRILLPSRAH